MKLRFFFVRAAAGSLAVGSAAPVNLPFEMQTVQIAASADAGKPARPAGETHQAPERGDVEIADGGDLQGEARLLKISAKGDLPCDSGDWATSPLFGPHAGLAAVLGVKPGHAQSGARDTSLADALDNRPATGGADSSAFGSVFGNASQPSIGGAGGGLFTTSGSTATSGGGSVIVGGGAGTGSGAGTGTGKGGGASNGGGATSGGGTGQNGGGPDKGGTGPNGGGIDTGSAGGTTPSGGVGSDGGTGPTGGDTGSTGNPDGGDISPIIPIQPINPGSGDHSGGASDGGSNGDGNTIDPATPGAVPEPSSWATMLVGFGLIGGMMRRHRFARFA